MAKSKRAALYVRVSTNAQTVENPFSKLREVAERCPWQVVETNKDTGISSAKGLSKPWVSTSISISNTSTRPHRPANYSDPEHRQNSRGLIRAVYVFPLPIGFKSVCFEGPATVVCPPLVPI